MNVAAFGLLAIALLAGANVMQWYRGEALAEKAHAVELDRDQKAAELTAAREEQARTQAAMEGLAAKMTTLRSNYEASQKTLRGIADDGCLRRDHPADVGRLLHVTDESAPSRPPGPDAGLRRQDVPGRHPVRATAPGVGPGVPGGGRSQSQGAGG